MERSCCHNSTVIPTYLLYTYRMSGRLHSACSDMRNRHYLSPSAWSLSLIYDCLRLFVFDLFSR